MHFREIKPQWAYYETWCFPGNKFLLYDQRKLSADVWPLVKFIKGFASHIKPQACNFSLWFCKSLWSVKIFTNFFSKHYYINEICSKSFELSDQHFMLLLLPSEHTDFLHCYITNSCSMQLHFVLVKSKLDKPVITHFYFWILSAQVL